MKRLLSILAIGLMVSFSGCSIKSTKAVEVGGLESLPQWYHSPRSLGDKFAAAGEAKPNKANDFSLQRTEAAAVARAELARMMEVEVKDMFKKATQQLGLGKEQTIDHAMQSVTKQVSHAVLKGSYQKRIFQDKETKVLYVLYVIDEKDVNKTIKDSIETSLGNEKAMWQKFQATQMWQELEKSGK